MFIASMVMLAQVETTVNKPSLFYPGLPRDVSAWRRGLVDSFGARLRARARLWSIGEMVFVRRGLPAAVSYSNHRCWFWNGDERHRAWRLVF